QTHSLALPDALPISTPTSMRAPKASHGLRAAARIPPPTPPAIAPASTYPPTRPRFGCSAGHTPRWPPMAEKPVAMPPHMAAQCTPPMSPASSAAPMASQSTGMGRAVARRGVGGAGLRRQRFRIVVAQDVDGGRVQVLELALAHRPAEGPDGHAEQDQADRDQEQEDVHAASGRARRRALRVTASEDSAMPSAATHGVTRPAAARGTASTL